jgi:uncharacterized protein (DUF1684 family)
MSEDRIGGVEWEQWRRGRFEAATAPFGTAALDRTEWLSEQPRALSGLSGSWRVDGGVVVADGLSGSDGSLRLSPGEEAEIDGVRVRAFDRRGSAVRVFDPGSANRTSVRAIDAYAHDPAWRLTGRFRPAVEEVRVDVVAVDGVVSSARLAGEIDLHTPEGSATLTVTGGAGGGFSAVLGDATNGVETYRFRFVDLGEGPDGDEFVVDFNRLYLPPCAFSEEYVCPTPLPGNRWTIPVRAGERTVVRG